MKIMSACANGSGTSLMLSRTARKAMEQLGYENYSFRSYFCFRS